MDESTRPSLPDSGSVPPVPESVSSSEEEGESQDFSHLSREYRDGMRRLHREVEQAVATIKRLRAENQRLRRRVEELEDQPAFPDAEMVLTLNDDPGAVKERISRFIDAIDTYLDGVESDSPRASEEHGSN